MARKPELKFSPMPLWVEYYDNGFIDMSKLDKWPPTPFKNQILRYQNAKRTGMAVLNSGGTMGIVNPQKELFPTSTAPPKMKLGNLESFTDYRPGPRKRMDPIWGFLTILIMMWILVLLR
jgi:hypothetical protein